MKRLLTVVGAAVLALAGTGVAAGPAAAAGVSDSPVPAMTVNDAVNSVAYYNGTIFSGGEFTYAYYGGKRHVRSYLAATSSTGELKSFAPSLNGAVHAVAVDSRYLYAAGTFSQVNGVSMKRVARFSMSTGKVDPNFTVQINALPRALELSGSTLYIGGDFSSVDGQRRTKLAAVSTSTGELTGFAPEIDRGVRAIEAYDGHVYIGGGFTQIDGTSARKLASLNASTGALETGFAPAAAGTVYDVVASGSRVYTAEGGAGGRVHAYDLSGDTLWQRTTDGDVVALTLHEGTIYAGGHFEKVCNNANVGAKGTCLDGVFADRRKLLAVSTSNSLSAWNPDADSVLGAISLASGGNTVAAGGAFLTFDGGTVKQRGLALFRQ